MEWGNDSNDGHFNVLYELVEHEFHQLEFDVYRASTNSDLLICELLAKNIAQRLMGSGRVKVWFENKIATYERSDAANSNFSIDDFIEFPEYVCIDSDPHFGFVSQQQKDSTQPNLNGISISYVSKNRNFRFSMLITFEPIDGEVFDAEQLNKIEFICHFTKGFRRLSQIISSIRQHRLYGDLSIKVHSYCQTTAPNLDYSQMNEITEMVQEVKELESCKRTIQLVKYLITFVYSALSHQTINSLERLRTDKTLALFDNFIANCKVILDQEDNFFKSNEKDNFFKFNKDAIKNVDSLNLSLIKILYIISLISDTNDKTDQGLLEVTDTVGNEYTYFSDVICCCAFYLRNKNKDSFFWDKLDEIICDFIPLYINQKNLQSATNKAELPQEKEDLKCFSCSLDRHKVRLLFICNLLTSLNKSHSVISPSRIVELRTSIAYVVHETLRYMGMNEVSFLTQPLRFAKCLLTIIRFHAEFIIKVTLPAKLFLEFNRLVIAKEMINRQIELENVQHTTDVYMAGFIFINMNVDIKDASDKDSTHFEKVSSYISSLSNDKDERAEKDIEKSFAIAAIFHDVGLLPKFNSVDPEDALSYLIGHSILKEEEKKTLMSWTDNKKKHALVSAYLTLSILEEQNNKYLTHSFYEEDSYELELERKNVIFPAIRAILYHVCPTFTPAIGKLKDPVLSLLCVFDEIYVWEPSNVYEPLPLTTALTDKEFNLVPLSNSVSYSFQDCFVSLGKDFPQFSFILPSNQDTFHKDCTDILRLAQAFGQLKEDYKGNDKSRWVPRGIVNRNESNSAYSIKEILDTLDKAATAISNEASPLIHRWLRLLQEGEDAQDDSIVLGRIKKPFANIDIRDHFREIEDYITRKYKLD